MSAESDPLFSPEHEPTRALLLAQALEACIQAERHVPGSAGHVIARQPAWARAELRRLVSLACSLDATATSAVMSQEFRVAARARLMHRIAPEHYALLPAVVPNGHAVPASTWLISMASQNGHVRTRHPRRRWIWRGSIGGLLAAGLLAAATITASANALPGEPLYGVKQVREEIGLRLASDDQARALLLLNQADMRLDEAARLLQEGRTDEVAQTTQRFDEALERATTTYVVTIDGAASPDQLPDVLEARLAQQQQQLQSLLSSAPEPARADLREALVATERSRALMAEPQPVERRGARSAPAAAAPTAAAEVYVEPTSMPELPAVPPPVDILAQATELPIADDPDRHEGRGFNASTSAAVVTHTNPPVVTPRRPNVVPDKRVDVHLDRVEDAQVVPHADVNVDDGLVAAPHPVDARDNDATNRRGVDKTDGPDDRDHIVAPSPNQNDAHERVAEQAAPAAQTSAVMTQRQSGNNDSHDESPQQQQTPSIAETSGGAHPPIAHDDANQVRQQPTQLQTAHTPPPPVSSVSASNSGDRRTGTSTTTARTDGGGSHSGSASGGDNSSAGSASSGSSPSGGGSSGSGFSSGSGGSSGSGSASSASSSGTSAGSGGSSGSGTGGGSGGSSGSGDHSGGGNHQSGGGGGH